MPMLIAFFAVAAIAAAGYIGGAMPGLQYMFGILLPLMAIIVFLAGFVRKVWSWAQTPVPFCIATTVGQQKSLPCSHDGRAIQRRPKFFWPVRRITNQSLQIGWLASRIRVVREKREHSYRDNHRRR